MKITDKLKKILKDGAAAHGLLLVGGNTEHIKKSIAESLKALESTAGNSSPLIDAEFFEKLSDASLGIHAARRLKEFLSQKPLKSSQKTAIIVDGDNLTHEAQNALLKISEDPPPNSRIIMLVKNEENLLPTLRSRFQKIFLTDADMSGNTANEIPEEVMNLAERFLRSDARARSEIIKLVIGKSQKGNKEGETGDDNTLVFLDALIFKLAKDPVGQASFLGLVLKQKMLISSLSLNRRLQLAFLSSLWYNRQ